MNFTKIENKKINEVVYCAEHETGLGVFVIPKKGHSKKYAMFATKYGSINREFFPLGENKSIVVPDGVAHFLEHKMFEQPDGSNAFDDFSLYGASANAFTSFTTTCYIFSCTSNFSKSFEHLLNYVQSPYFTPENVEKEQGIIGQEIRMYNDDAEWAVMFNALRAMYHNNPVKIDIAGTVESISEIDKDVLYTCYNTFYNPSNMIVCVAGDVDVDEIGDIIEKAIKKDRPSGEVTTIRPDEPKTVVTHAIEERFSVSIPLFNMAFKDNDLKKGEELLRNEISLALILRILAGKSSDLFENMYKKGIINDNFSTDYMTENEFSCAIIGGECTNPDQVKKDILEAIKELSSRKITKEELDRTKKAITGSFLRQFNDVESVVGIFAKNILKGVNSFEYLDIMDSIDTEFINKRLADVFNEENMVFSVIYPK